MSKYTSAEKAAILGKARATLARPNSKYTNAERAAILAKARTTLARLEARYPTRKVPPAIERRDRIPRVVFKTTVNERALRSHDSESTFTLPSAAHREYLRELLAQLVAELRWETADNLKLAVRPLAADLADLKASIAEQRLERVNERSREVIDLPALPLRPRELN
jgi:hypothetical protein